MSCFKRVSRSRAHLESDVRQWPYFSPLPGNLASAPAVGPAAIASLSVGLRLSIVEVETQLGLVILPLGRTSCCSRDAASASHKLRCVSSLRAVLIGRVRLILVIGHRDRAVVVRMRRPGSNGPSDVLINRGTRHSPCHDEPRMCVVGDDASFMADAVGSAQRSGCGDGQFHGCTEPESVVADRRRERERPAGASLAGGQPLRVPFVVDRRVVRRERRRQDDPGER